MASLYERIGGEENVKLMVTAFYQRVLLDPLISPFFQDTEIEKLEKMQVAFFTIALGGDEPPKMPSLLASHRGLGVESRHLTRFTELLVQTLEEVGIPEQETKEIYARISTYSNDILGETSVDG